MDKSSNQMEVVKEGIEEGFFEHAEDYPQENFLGYFANPPVMHDIRSPYHHLIVGRKGTGKTMILRSMSIKAWLEKDSTGQDEKGSSNIPDYVGFYLKFHREHEFPILRPPNTQIGSNLFQHWFNLSLLSSILSVFSNSEGQSQIKLEEEKFDEIKSLLGNVKDLNDLEEFKEFVDQWSKETFNLLHHLHPRKQPPGNLEKIMEKQGYGGQITLIPHFLRDLTARILKPTFNNKPIFFLLDEFDNLPKPYQEDVANLIISAQNQPYFAKLGTRQKKDVEAALPLDRYHIINIENFDPTGDRYFKFCENVLQQRVRMINEKLEEKDNAEVNIKTDVESLLLKSEEADYYAGFDEIVRLSSGFIRNFVEIVYEILDASIHNGGVLISSGFVPPDVQNDRILADAQQRVRDELSTQVGAATANIDEEFEESLGDYAQRFVKNLLRKFDSRSEEVQICNRFKASKLPEGKEGRLMKILLEALEEVCGITRQREKRGLNFSVNRIFSPYKNLPPIVTEAALEFTPKGLENALGHPYYQQKDDETTKKLFDEKVKCFFATAFGEKGSWHLRVRKLLREEIFGNNNLEYIDGEKAHQSTHIAPKVKELMNRASTYIFDITGQNVNVCLEYGLGLSLLQEKSMFLIWNKNAKGSRSDRTEFFDGEEDRSYSFPINSSPSEESLEQGKEELEKTIRQIRDTINKGRQILPFEKDELLHILKEVSPMKNSVYLYAPEESELTHWENDLRDFIEKKLNYEVYSVPAYGPDAKHRIIKHLKGIARCTECIIDTSQKNLNSTILLGFAYGLERRPLSVYKADGSGIPTNWSGMDLECEYDSKDHLFREIKKYLQSS